MTGLGRLTPSAYGRPHFRQQGLHFLQSTHVPPLSLAQALECPKRSYMQIIARSRDEQTTP
jgi:hypothetical protein